MKSFLRKFVFKETLLYLKPKSPIAYTEVIFHINIIQTIRLISFWLPQKFTPENVSS